MFARFAVMLFVLLAYSNITQANFTGGQTGAADDQLKAACPAFISGDFKLISTSANQSNLVSSDLFEHETGARCACTRNKMEKTMRCGPTAARGRTN